MPQQKLLLYLWQRKLVNTNIIPKTSLKNCTSLIINQEIFKKKKTVKISVYFTRPPPKSLQFLVIGRLQNRCSDMLSFLGGIFFANRKICDNTWSAGTKFPIYKVRWLRQASQIRQTFIPLCVKSFKTQHGRIPIDPAISAAIGHRQRADTRNCFLLGGGGCLMWKMDHCTDFIKFVIVSF